MESFAPGFSFAFLIPSAETSDTGASNNELDASVDRVMTGKLESFGSIAANRPPALIRSIDLCQFAVFGFWAKFMRATAPAFFAETSARSQLAKSSRRSTPSGPAPSVITILFLTSIPLNGFTPFSELDQPLGTYTISAVVSMGAKEVGSAPVPRVTVEPFIEIELFSTSNRFLPQVKVWKNVPFSPAGVAPINFSCDAI